MVKVDGQNLNELIIQNGYAWVYPQYYKEQFCSQWKQTEAEARQRKSGSGFIPRLFRRRWRHLEKASQGFSIAGNDYHEIPISRGLPNDIMPESEGFLEELSGHEDGW